MNSQELKARVIKDGKENYLSAQDFDALNLDEKKAFREALADEGKNPDEYEARMRLLFPKEFHPKPLTWRRK